MTTNQKDQNRPHATPSEVTAAVSAMIAARQALMPPMQAPSRSPLVTVRRTDGSIATCRAAAVMAGEVVINPEQVSKVTRYVPPSAEAIELAQEAALAGFPDHVQAAARLALHRLEHGVPRQTSSSRSTPNLVRPSPTPRNLPERRPDIKVPPFPTAGLDDADVREAWEESHRAAAEAHFQLQPAVLKAYCEAQLACEKWDAVQRGRKPSGDLRHPVPRDRLERIEEELREKQKKAIARAERIIHAIETGDVAGVEVDEGFGESTDDWYDDEGNLHPASRYSGVRIATLVLQSELDRAAAARHARGNRSPEEIEAEDAAWDQLIDEMLANLPPEKPKPETPNLPDLPTDRDPTSSEIRAFSNAVRKHMDYLKKGEQIEAKRQKDAETKVRTQAKRRAEQADPEGTAAAKEASARSKAAERQRRWRESQKTPKDILP